MDEITLKNLIAKELGLEGAPEETLNDVFAETGQSIIERTSLAILERLSLEEQEAFGAIASKDGYEKACEFASSKIENFGEFVKNEAREEIEALKSA